MIRVSFPKKKEKNKNENEASLLNLQPLTDWLFFTSSVLNSIDPITRQSLQTKKTSFL